jgi:geranylgeranyl reductase family protein
VLIAGGGPAGSLSAIYIGKEHDVTVVEEHQSAGFPVQCAGLISESCYTKLREFVSDRCYLNDIKGAFFFSPDGNYLEMIGDSKAVVIERKVLDSELLKRAAKYAEVRLKTTFKHAEGNIALLKSPEGAFTVEYNILIGADGASSSVARTFGFRKPEFFSALQFECGFEAIDSEMVELYFGRRYSDSFFGYAVPVDEETARIGVVSREDSLHYLNNILEKHPSVSRRVKKRKLLELNAGVIPIGIVNFVKGNVALIGDSAGMVKPYTGGGLYYHLVAAEILGMAFPDLNAYREAYMKKMGLEYRIGEKIHHLYSTLSDEDYNMLVKVGREEQIGEIVKNLHMDSPSSMLKILPKILKILSKNPKLFARVGKTLL